MRGRTAAGSRPRDLRQYPQRSVVVVTMSRDTAASRDTAGWTSGYGGRGMRGRSTELTRAVRPVPFLESSLCDIRGQCCLPDAFLSHNSDLQARPIAWPRDSSCAGANAH